MAHAPDRIFLPPALAESAGTERLARNEIEYARVVPPAAPTVNPLNEDRCMFCGGKTAHEPDCDHGVRRVSADEADKALALRVEDFLLMPHGVELKTLLPRLQTRILAALAQARKQTWEKAIAAAKDELWQDTSAEYGPHRVEQNRVITCVIDALESASKQDR